MTWRTLLVVGICVLAVAGTTSAQTPMGSTETVTGTIVSSGGGSLVIDTDTGRQTFFTDADSRLPSTLTTGSRISVDFHRLSDGRMHVASATLLGTAPISTTATGPTQTVTGTVVSSGSTQIVLDTATGRRTFIVDADSDVDSDVIAGSRATVEYNTFADGRLHAEEVDLEMAAAAAPAPVQMASDLPQTASDLPTVGLVGLIALAGGLAIRFARQHTA
jgi:hypothetical protein